MPRSYYGPYQWYILGRTSTLFVVQGFNLRTHIAVELHDCGVRIATFMVWLYVFKMSDNLFWDLPEDVLAAPASALRGWKGVMHSLSLYV